MLVVLTVRLMPKGIASRRLLAVGFDCKLTAKNDQFGCCSDSTARASTGASNSGYVRVFHWGTNHALR